MQPVCRRLPSSPTNSKYLMVPLAYTCWPADKRFASWFFRPGFSTTTRCTVKNPLKGKQGVADDWPTSSYNILNTTYSFSLFVVTNNEIVPFGESIGSRLILPQMVASILSEEEILFHQQVSFPFENITYKLTRSCGASIDLRLTLNSCHVPGELDGQTIERPLHHIST